MSTPSKKGAKSENTAVISEKETSFIMACLRNTTGGSISVDTHAVATAVGLTNPRSVNNKLSDIRKKYSIPLSAGKAGGTTILSDEPIVPKTPSKNRATKAKTPRKAPNKAFKSMQKSGLKDKLEAEIIDDIKVKRVAEDE